MFSELRANKNLQLTILAGLILRVLFVLVGAKFYFGRENIFVDGDTQVWVACIQNLIETGIYTMNPGHEYGYFGRTPGYSFFIGIFYLLTGKDWNAAYPIIAWTQVVLDAIAIYFIYKIGLKLFPGQKKYAVIPAILYATYPFVIVWNPVVYSEAISIFFLVVGFYYFISEEKKINYILSGIFISFSVLCRPQILALIGLLGLFLLIKNRKDTSALLTKSIQFGLTVAIVYGSWPIRNYINYGKIELTHDLRGFEVWGTDAIAFREYIYSIKAEWEPQFSDILHNKNVYFPKEAYISKQDSLNLGKAIFLSKNCGSGFSHWRGYWKEPITGKNCNDEIKKIFDDLKENQTKHNPVNYYIILPLKNLQKAIFKTKLYDTKSAGRKIASLLLIYRTLMIILGLAGIIIIFKQNKELQYIAWLILSYFLFLYLLICAGTGPDFRNIEMRYFLPADILLLLTASIPLTKIINKFSQLDRT